MRTWWRHAHRSDWRDELIADLRASLRAYGVHREYCALALARGTCTCSFEEALRR